VCVRFFAGILHTLQLNANRIIHGLTNNKEQRKQMHMNPFYKVVIPIINNTLPFKRIKMRDNDKSWITHEIKDLMNRKDNAHKKGNHGLMQTIQHKLSKAIDRALQKRTNTKMQTTSLKEKWRFLKSCISSNKHHTCTFDTITAKGINVTF
jgi:hypothetical protein